VGRVATTTACRENPVAGVAIALSAMLLAALAGCDWERDWSLLDFELDVSPTVIAIGGTAEARARAVWLVSAAVDCPESACPPAHGIRFSVADPTVVRLSDDLAHVDTDGWATVAVTGLAPGATTITASSSGVSSQPVAVTVVP